MKYILIMMWNLYQPGVQTFTQEFDSIQACQRASVAVAMAHDPDGQMDHLNVNLCIAKGTE